MTRVLVIEPAGNLWGSERALLDVADRMPDLDIAVCCPPGKPLVAELERKSVRTFPCFVYALHEKSVWARTWAALGVVRACLEFRPDVIHLNQGGCYRIALPAATLFNLPIVAHVRIFEDAAYFAARAPDPRRLRGIVAISRAIETELRRHPQLAAIPVHVLYDAYVRDSGDDQLVSRNHGRIACIGRIVPIKGLSLLIDAMQRLKGNGGDDIECIVAGDGPAEYVAQLETAAQDAPIKWLGVRNDVVPLLRTCGVLACPSEREPLGRVIFEAWDAGAVPVACAASGGAAEVMALADGGILYAEQTPESLAAALQAALRLLPGEAAQLIGNGRAWMSQHCEPQRYGEALAELLTRACTSDARR